MKYLIYLLAIIVILGINIGLFDNLQINGQIPNLLFLLVLYFSLEKKDLDFLFISLVAGLFLDFFSAGFFGGFTITFLIIGFLGHLFVSNLVVFEYNWKTLSLALLAGLILSQLLLWFYGLMAYKFSLSGQYVDFKIFIADFPIILFYNWLMLYPMYLFFNFLRGMVNKLNLSRRGVIN